jgi:hypothetical protein
MGKNFTKSEKNNKIYNSKNLNKSISEITPSRKSIDFIIAYSKSTKSILDRKFLISLN